MLFDESDVADNMPKAEAAANKLRAINSAVTIEPVVADIDRTNILDLCRDADVILDGTDNFEVRYTDQRRGGEARQAVGLRRLRSAARGRR